MIYTIMHTQGCAYACPGLQSQHPFPGCNYADILNLMTLSVKRRNEMPGLLSKQHLLSLLLYSLALVCTACQTQCCKIEPEICYIPRAQLIQDLPSPFEKLTRTEIRQEWGKELYVGLTFAHEMDLYRAITAFKRALIFLPSDNPSRRLQIEYSIFLCYYLGQKYQDALDTFEQGQTLQYDGYFSSV